MEFHIYPSYSIVDSSSNKIGNVSSLLTVNISLLEGAFKLIIISSSSSKFAKKLKNLMG